MICGSLPIFPCSGLWERTKDWHGGFHQSSVVDLSAGLTVIIRKRYLPIVCMTERLSKEWEETARLSVVTLLRQ
jgi:hypothetical protein